MDPRSSGRKTRASFVLLCLMLGGMLAAGLYPRGLSLRNDVAADAAGLRFGPYGIAYTEPFLTEGRCRRLAATGFTIHVAFELPEPPSPGFNFIFAFTDGDDSSQLLLGQWRDFLIVMNGDDYSHRLKTPRLTVDTSQEPTSRTMLTLVVHGNTQTAQLYLNGKLRSSKDHLELHLPAYGGPVRLVLGNSPHANGSFEGTLSRFALIGRVLSGEEIRRHTEQWERRLPWPAIIPDKAILAYQFDQGPGGEIGGPAGQEIPLRIPATAIPLVRRVMAWSTLSLEYRRGLVFDAFVNLLGFVPFGFLATIVFRRGREGRVVASLLIVALFGGLVSLGIEYAQSWMASRSSSLLDFILNTVGATAGSALQIGLPRWRPRR